MSPPAGRMKTYCGWKPRSLAWAVNLVIRSGATWNQTVSTPALCIFVTAAEKSLWSFSAGYLTVNLPPNRASSWSARWTISSMFSEWR